MRRVWVEFLCLDGCVPPVWAVSLGKLLARKCFANQLLSYRGAIWMGCIWTWGLLGQLGCNEISDLEGSVVLV